ncbi:DNA primase family protein [Selenomonas massiliensis]|uniref:DNA primase family protein n=1 Tax=Selenomonas massiliensis TaxID=2058293 RepID=UPI000D11136D|nr:phage/plasmid primase, P4 family [Selenomonas massiliensis]
MGMTIDELKAQKIWICWNYAMQNGNRTKMPCAADGGITGSNHAFRASWVTFEEARHAAEASSYSGVGFIIPKGMYFLDIDHRDEADAMVQLQIRRHDTYAEKSVSGNGIHIYGCCDYDRIPKTKDKDGKEKLDSKFYVKNPHNKMELYVGGLTNRFAVFTGDVFHDAPLNDGTEAVLTTLKKDMLRKQPVNYRPKEDGDRTVFDIVCSLRKAKNGGKFARLFDRGDISEYGSASEADAALCALIAFRTGDDTEMIDAVFRMSALYRKKWERADYKAATIRTGVEACHGVFHASVMDHPDFIHFNTKGQAVISCPALADYIRQHLSYIFVRDSARHGVLRYVYEGGVYRLYADDMLKGLIKNCIAAYDPEMIEMRKVDETFRILTTDLDYIKDSDLNADEDIINFQNGILHLSTMELTEHSADILSTIQIPCEWAREEITTPVFDVFMQTLTDGEIEIEHLLLEFIGACLSNVKGWRMKKALFMYGAGDTGKSRLKCLVEQLLGRGNYVGIDLREIEVRFGTGLIYGMRLAGSSDMSFITVDELKTFKKCTGGDSIFAEFKGQNGFEFTFNGLFWFCMNQLPRFGGDDGQWVHDRIMQVHCKNAIPIDKQDRLLGEKLYAERDGIVRKAIHALRAVIQNGYRFTEPQSVLSAREEYMVENNSVLAFHAECMMKRPEGAKCSEVTTGKVYRIYQAWCRDNNNGFAKTAREFRTTLARYYKTDFSSMTIRRSYGSVYKDLILNEDAVRECTVPYNGAEEDFL